MIEVLVMNIFTEWLKNHKNTVCHELNRQGLLSDEDLITDIKYGVNNYPKAVIGLYKIAIVPIVLLMKRSKWFTRIVFRIANRYWFSKFLNTKQKVS